MGKAERTRQFIIQTAAPIFNEKGIAGTTIDDVLEATKMAKGGLYGHFDSKEEIAYTMVDFLLGKLSDKVILEVSKEKTAKGKLFAFMNVYKNPLASYIEGGCPILNFGVESDDTSPVIKKKVKNIIEGTKTMLTEIINTGIINKEFAETINADDFALKLFSMMEGGMMVSRVTNSNKPMNDLIRMLKKDLELHEIKT
ncbi:TetR/AcrR family transcriptional regulator [Dyadobacter frigoris]|uniref:TetR/AcrR family transcriptional regulator n=1 Tax=Dyadobacter frigoris TaxID=2576211 RepID=A0A4U6D863_9BACT|nr:TetR/AcrR family transcriptional regulator [Dyadobacter frigoris]TKT90324.1 TetR/AcrR family transcriptional regulator [Dyadobacter frigoris]GLU52563.1 TetR family transcriptional regulator [Dyadobacter frigoris]